MAKKALGWFLFLLVAVGLVGCDHATKFAVQATLGPRGPLHLVPGVVDLVYTENHDTAFSLFRAFGTHASKLALVGLASVALIAIVVFAVKRWRDAGLAERLAYALVLAGAIGNVADRAVRGYVVDFIHVHHWPVFNVADIAVVAGALLLLFSMRRGSGANTPPASMADPPPTGAGTE